MKSKTYALATVSQGVCNTGFQWESSRDSPGQGRREQHVEGQRGSVKQNSPEKHEPAVTIQEVPTPDSLLGTKHDPLRKWRLYLQSVLIICWICIGFYQEIVGPTLPDLNDRMGVNYEEVVQALVGRDVGSLVGSIIGGYLHERFYKHSLLMIGICTLIPGLVVAAIPFSAWLGLTFVLFMVNGISEGITNAGGNTMVMHLWGEHSSSPMQAMHAGFGLGALFCPLLARPFLGPDKDTDDMSTTFAPTTASNFYNMTDRPRVEVSTIEIPYGIIAALCVVGSIVVLATYAKGVPDGLLNHIPTKSVREMASPKLCGHGYAFYAIELLVCLFLYSFQAVGIARGFGKFIFSYATETKSLGFTKDSAALVNTLYWVGFTVGRVGGAVVARLIPAQWMIVGHLFVGTVLSVVMSVIGHTDDLAVWICTPLFGVVIAVQYPLGMSFGNIYLNMNSVATTIIILGGSVGGISYQYLIGYLFETDTRNFNFYFLILNAIFIVVYVVMQSLASIHGRKVHNNIAEQDDRYEG